jgi:hypothetical protein
MDADKTVGIRRQAPPGRVLLCGARHRAEGGGGSDTYAR